MINRRFAWNRQPPGPVEIDRGNSLTFGQVLDSRGDLNFRDAVAGRQPLESVGSLSKTHTLQGVAANFSSAVTSFGDLELFSGAQATFQIIDVPDTLTQVAGLVNKRSSSTSQNAYSLGYNYVGADFTVDVGNSAGSNLVLSYRFSRSTFSTSGNNIIVTVDGTLGAGSRVKALRNGVPLSVTVGIDGAFSNFPDTTYPLELGRVNSGTLYYAGKILLVRAWNRALSDGESEALSENPWQTYRPIQRRIWVGLAGGGTNGTANGVTLTDAASLIPGAATGQRNENAAGQVLPVAASLIPGSASSSSGATANGVTLPVAASILAGTATGVINATAPGATLTVGASLLPGAASSSAVAAGSTLTVAASILPGAASSSGSAVAPGATLQAGASLIPGAASAVRNATAFGAFLELITTFVPGQALTLSSEPSLYVAYVQADNLIARVPAGAFTAFVPADATVFEVPPGDYTATV